MEEKWMEKMDRVETRSSIVAFLADNKWRRRRTLVSLSLHRCTSVRCWSRSSSRHCSICPENTGAPKEQWDARQQPTQWEPNESWVSFGNDRGRWSSDFILFVDSPWPPLKDQWNGRWAGSQWHWDRRWRFLDTTRMRNEWQDCIGNGWREVL
jgi:hypothetical protein